VDSLKALDPKRPIREADMAEREYHVRFVPLADIAPLPWVRHLGYSFVIGAASGTCRPPAAN
jgi:hypothetical protein